MEATKKKAAIHWIQLWVSLILANTHVFISILYLHFAKSFVNKRILALATFSFVSNTHRHSKSTPKNYKIVHTMYMKRHWLFIYIYLVVSCNNIECVYECFFVCFLFECIVLYVVVTNWSANLFHCLALNYVLWSGIICNCCLQLCRFECDYCPQ